MSLVVIPVNLDKEREGEAELIKYASRVARETVRARKAEGAVLALTERGHGTKSVRVRPVDGLPVGTQRWTTVLPVGAHNAIAWRDITVDGEIVRQVTAHGLHRKTVGRRAQMAYWAALVAILARWTVRGIRWSLAGDFNLGFRAVARMLGGRGVGRGVDGVIVSRGLRVRLVRVDFWGVLRRLTDHPMVVTVVSAKPRRKRRTRPIAA